MLLNANGVIACQARASILRPNVVMTLCRSYPFCCLLATSILASEPNALHYEAPNCGVSCTLRDCDVRVITRIHLCTLTRLCLRLHCNSWL